MADGAHALEYLRDAERPAIHAPAPLIKATPPLTVQKQKAIITRDTVKRNVAFALQGGGAHGRLGAAILGAIAADPQFRDAQIRLISGASAGGINGSVFTGALHDTSIAAGNRRQEGAKRLDALWTENAVENFSGEFFRDAVELTSCWAFNTASATMNNIFELGMSVWTKGQHTPRMASLPRTPTNAEYINKYLSGLLKKHFTRIGNFIDSGPALHVGTSRLDPQTGTVTPAIFSNSDIDPLVILASSAVLTIFPIQQINGEFHIDGGYTANPNLDPLDRDESITDEIHIMNTVDPRSGRHSMENNPLRHPRQNLEMQSAWAAAIKRQQYHEENQTGRRIHIIGPDQMPTHPLTLIRPTRAQNESLRVQGEEIGKRFITDAWVPQREDIRLRAA